VNSNEPVSKNTLRGLKTVAESSDELDAAWRWIDPIGEGWAQHDERVKSSGKAPGLKRRAVSRNFPRTSRV
jgi:glucose-6-phosphate 1-dehydrogenase